MKKALLFVSILGVVAAAPAQSHTLRLNAKPNQVFNYSMNMQATSMNMGMKMAMKVVKVQKGQFTINTTIPSMTMNGQPAPPAVADRIKQLMIVTVMDSRGNVLKTETKGAPGMGPGANQNTSVPFPAGPVKVGSTWSGVADMNGQKIKTSYKLIAFKSVSGKQSAVIHATPQGVAQMKFDGPIVFSVELSTGMLVSMSMSGTAQGQAMKMTMKRV